MWGMKLQDKIDFTKQERTINTFINLDTKEIDWEPIIDDAVDYWEPVIDTIEEYKEGGKLETSDQEPIIQDIEDWEPIIDDVTVYKDG